MIGSKCTDLENGDIDLYKVAHFFWFHTPSLYNSYDTMQKINGLIKRKEHIRFDITEEENKDKFIKFR